MDSLTHIALGACVGEAMLGKKLGKKALFIGAFANSIPDFDFLATLWTGTDEYLLAHRGFTHSLLFAVLMTGLMALSFQRWWRRYAIPAKTWMLFFAAELFLHIFIDACNSYGTGWFEPFSHYRISFNIIFVADPFFSIWLIISFIVLLIKKRSSGSRMFWAKFGLGLSLFYFLHCVFNKIRMDADVSEIFKKQNIVYTKYLSTPTPLNNWLWYVVAANDSGYHIGYRSVFDRRKKIDFHFYAKNDSLLTDVLHHEEVQRLLRFSKDFYIVEKRNGELVFNDLRFGQIAGWHQQPAGFVFHYALQHPATNKMVVQRGRFEGWSRESFQSLLKRIRGN
jgi:inner membrane protein